MIIVLIYISYIYTVEFARSPTWEKMWMNASGIARWSTRSKTEFSTDSVSFPAWQNWPSPRFSFIVQTATIHTTSNPNPPNSSKQQWNITPQSSWLPSSRLCSLLWATAPTSRFASSNTW